MAAAVFALSLSGLCEVWGQNKLTGRSQLTWVYEWNKSQNNEVGCEKDYITITFQMFF